MRLGLFLAVAAAAMVATLPGRSQGLGLITEPLLADLRLERVAYATLSFWATLIGAAFCIPCGWLLDRIGVRAMLAAALAGLGCAVVAMSGVAADSGGPLTLPAPEVFFAGGLEWVSVPFVLFLLVLLTRGIGQSALSVVSLALVGKVAGKKPGPAIGVYSFLVTVGFMVAFGLIQVSLERWNTSWRTMWAGIGWTLLAGGVLAALFARNPPREIIADEAAATTLTTGHTFGQALCTPAFWVFGLATAFYGMIAAGVSLFNQSILAERRFERDVFLTITTLTPMIGLAANLATGWLARSWSMGRLLAMSMVILAGALLAFPFVSTLGQVYAYAAAMGAAGGMVTVIFFGVWGQAFGTARLGQIQGAAQLLTVLGSASGPLLLAAAHRADGSYTPLFQKLAIVCAIFALAAWFVPMPRRLS